MLNDFEKELQEKGWLRVVRNIEPDSTCLRHYNKMTREMSIIHISNGPVGNGRLHEHVFYFQTPNDILDFGERTEASRWEESRAEEREREE